MTNQCLLHKFTQPKNNLLSKKSSLRKCPICDKSSVEVLHTQKFVLQEGHPLSDGYDVVCCNRCGFVFADTRVTQEEYDRFYMESSKYEDRTTSTGSGETPGDAERLEDTASQISRFLPDKSARILDIGCANGGLLNELRKSGYVTLCGIDPSARCVANTKALGMNAFTGSLAQLPADLGEFQCVILSHVLEHVRDLRKAVQALYALSSRRGIVYIEVPDATRYADFLFSPFQDFNTEHINHFSLICLTKLMQLVGFDRKHENQKIIEWSPDMPYPVLYGIYEKADNSEPVLSRGNDRKLRSAILEYVKKSRIIMDRFDSDLQRVLTKTPEVIVWGTGQLAMKLLAETSLAKAQIMAFVDGNSINHGKMILGKRIIAPQEVKSMNHPIVITSVLHSREIEKVIRNEMGLNNPIICLQRPPL